MANIPPRPIARRQLRRLGKVPKRVGHRLGQRERKLPEDIVDQYLIPAYHKGKDRTAFGVGIDGIGDRPLGAEPAIEMAHL